MPSGLPLTVVKVSHSSEALNSSRWFFSHMALWEEQARSIKTFLPAPMSVDTSGTRSSASCSLRPAEQVELVDVAKRANMIHNRFDVVPIGDDGGDRPQIATVAGR